MIDPGFVSFGDDRIAGTEGYDPVRSALRWLAGAWIAELVLIVLTRLVTQLGVVAAMRFGLTSSVQLWLSLLRFFTVGSIVGAIAIEAVVIAALLRMRRTTAAADVDTPAIVGAAAAGGSIAVSIGLMLFDLVWLPARRSIESLVVLQQVLQLLGLAAGLVETGAILWLLARLARATSTRVPRGPAIALGAALAFRYLSWLVVALVGESFGRAQRNHPWTWLALSLLATVVTQGVLIAFALGLDKKLAVAGFSATAPPRIVAAPDEESLAALGTRNMIRGGIAFAAGTVITIGTYSAASGGGTYVVAWGAIAYGAIQFFRGVSQRSRARR